MPFQIDDFTTVQTPHRMHHVNLYLRDRFCFGPEEGGNWGDVGTFIRCLGKNLDREAAEVIRDTHKPHIAKMNEGKPPISSVRSEGEYIILVEGHAGADYPAGPVHYQ